MAVSLALAWTGEGQDPDLGEAVAQTPRPLALYRPSGTWVSMGPSPHTPGGRVELHGPKGLLAYTHIPVRPDSKTKDYQVAAGRNQGVFAFQDVVWVLTEAGVQRFPIEAELVGAQWLEGQMVVYDVDLRKGTVGAEGIQWEPLPSRAVALARTRVRSVAGAPDGSIALTGGLEVDGVETAGALVPVEGPVRAVPEVHRVSRAPGGFWFTGARQFISDSGDVTVVDSADKTIPAMQRHADQTWHDLTTGKIYPAGDPWVHLTGVPSAPALALAVNNEGEVFQVSRSAWTKGAETRALKPYASPILLRDGSVLQGRDKQLQRVTWDTGVVWSHAQRGQVVVSDDHRAVAIDSTLHEVATGKAIGGVPCEGRARGFDLDRDLWWCPKSVLLGGVPLPLSTLPEHKPLPTYTNGSTHLPMLPGPPRTSNHPQATVFQRIRPFGTVLESPHTDQRFMGSEPEALSFNGRYALHRYEDLVFREDLLRVPPWAGETHPRAPTPDLECRGSRVQLQAPEVHIVNGEQRWTTPSKGILLGGHLCDLAQRNRGEVWTVNSDTWSKLTLPSAAKASPIQGVAVGNQVLTVSDTHVALWERGTNSAPQMHHALTDRPSRIQLEPSGTVQIQLRDHILRWDGAWSRCADCTWTAQETRPVVGGLWGLRDDEGQVYWARGDGAWGRWSKGQYTASGVWPTQPTSRGKLIVSDISSTIELGMGTLGAVELTLRADRPVEDVWVGVEGSDTQALAWYQPEFSGELPLRIPIFSTGQATSFELVVKVGGQVVKRKRVKLNPTGPMISVRANDASTLSLVVTNTLPFPVTYRDQRNTEVELDPGARFEHDVELTSSLGVGLGTPFGQLNGYVWTGVNP